MKKFFVFIFLLSFIFLKAEQNSTTCKCDSFQVLCTNKIEKIVTEQTNKLYNEDKGWQLDYVMYWFTAIMLIIMIYGIIIEFRFKKNIVKDIKNTLEDDLEIMIKEKTDSVIKENIEVNLKFHKRELSKKESYKNRVLYDMSKWFSEKLQNSNSDKETQDAYTWHNERFSIINRLSYGNKEQIEKSLKELQVSLSSDLLKLRSFKRFLEFLPENDVDIDTLVKKLLISSD